jgi:hypothetical protein
MKNLITLNNEVLTINPEALLIQEFQNIWKKDKTKGKENALKELSYIYHTTDYQSIYRNYHPDIREGKIRFDIFGESQWKPSTLIKLAQEKYKELQTTLSMQILDDAETGLNKLRTYFRDIEFEDDDNGTQAKNFIANVKALGDVVKGMKSLRDEAEKELTDQMQLRGGSVIGRREIPPDRRG